MTRWRLKTSLISRTITELLSLSLCHPSITIPSPLYRHRQKRHQQHFTTGTLGPEPVEADMFDVDANGSVQLVGVVLLVLLCPFVVYFVVLRLKCCGMFDVDANGSVRLVCGFVGLLPVSVFLSCLSVLLLMG
jgi:hypothetical protein